MLSRVQSHQPHERTPLLENHRPVSQSGELETNPLKKAFRSLKNTWSDESKKNSAVLYSYVIWDKVQNLTAILKSGVNPNIMDEDGHTPLQMAAATGHAKCLTVLLQNQANPNRGDKMGKTPLHWAAMQGHAESVNILLSHIDDPNIPDIEGETPLHWAVDGGQTNCVQALLNDARVLVDATDNEGRTPLFFTGVNNKIVTLLLNEGADSTKKNHSWQTPLHAAAYFGGTDSLTTLLDRGAEKNTQDKNGMTPLHLAAMQGHVKSVDILLKYNAAVDIKNKEGKTPLSLAERKRHHDIVMRLREAEAEKRIQDEAISTPPSPIAFA